MVLVTSISYYASLANATAGKNAVDCQSISSPPGVTAISGISGVRIAYDNITGNYEVDNGNITGNLNGVTSWMAISGFDGSTSGPYYPTNSVPSGYNYYLYPAGGAPCFLEGILILCQVDGVDTYVPVEQLKPGTLVKTSQNGYKKVQLVGHRGIQNPGTDERTEQRLYKCSPSKYPELTEDLFLTGCHSILVSSLTDLEREKTIQSLGRIFITGNKYRLMACVDERAEPWNSAGTYTVWHFALENEDEKRNYGVYANGLLVETCCIVTMRKKMTLV